MGESISWPLIHHWEFGNVSGTKIEIDCVITLGPDASVQLDGTLTYALKWIASFNTDCSDGGSAVDVFSNDVELHSVA